MSGYKGGVKIIRFLDSNKAIRYGVPLDERTARLLEGDIFGRFRLTRQKARVKKLLSPVQPPNLLCIGLNYRRHAQESGAPIPKRPVLFMKATTALNHPGTPILLPKLAPEEVDYEVELCIVMGAKGKPLGYTVGNDVSARDVQLRQDQQWIRGKSFDTFCPLGPCLLIPENGEFDPDHARLRSRLNGKTMQESDTNDMIFSTAELVEFLGKNMTLLPGTLIMTGTPEGVGFARRPPVFLRPGDIIECEVEGIGVLQNPVRKA